MDEPWYKEGLRFKCTGCGKCCTGAPGVVWISEQEIEAIAAFLNITVKEFSIRYLRKVNGRFALVELKKTFDCIFLKDKKCQVYAVRPKQCRTFPFWPHILKNRETWHETAKDCEGIDSNAPIVPFETIENELNREN